MPWPPARLAKRRLSTRMHREKCSYRLRPASGAPVFANGAVTAAMAFAFNQLSDIERRRLIKQVLPEEEAKLTSDEGEAKTDFLKRVGKEMRDLADADSFEHCGAICSDGEKFQVTIGTSESHIGCAVDHGFCPSDLPSTGEQIHVHGQNRSTRPNDADRVFLRLRGMRVFSGQRISGQDVNNFSDADLTNGVPDYLYTGDGRLLFDGDR